MAGFIYVLSNPAYGNRLKIGKSAVDPEQVRAAELYNTSAPEPFVLEYYAFVDDYDRVEILVHRELYDHRPNAGREFFTVSVPDAIRAIKRHSRKIHFEKDPRQQRIAAEATERRIAAEAAARESEQRRQQALHEMRNAIAARIPDLKQQLKKRGDQILLDMAETVYPDPAGWKVLLILVFIPAWPFYFLWSKRHLRRQVSIWNSSYDAIRARALKSVDQLLETPYSENWEPIFRKKFEQIQSEFLESAK